MNTRLVGHVAEHKVYLATLTPPAAKDLLFVSSYDTADPMSNAVNHHGYQRPATKQRFAEIAKYFAAGDNRYLITPLTVSVRLTKQAEIERFLKLLAAGDVAAIKAVFGPNVASEVDGQHRLGGLVKAWENDAEFLPEIPIMLYFGLS